MTLEEATRIKNEIQKTIKTQISGDATTTTKTFTPTPTDLFDPKTGLYESEVDQSEPSRTLPPSPTDLFDPRTRLYESEVDQGEPTVTLPPSPVDVYDPSRGLYESEIDQGEPTPATDNKAARDQALQRGADYASRDMQDRIAANTYSFNEDDLERRDTSIDDVGTEEDPDSGGKIVCTMMNQSYGFGSFRNAIWLKYSKDNLSEEYQKGYHRIFLPLVAYAKGNGMSNKIIRNTLEHIAKHRTLDLRQEMRGAKRHTLGRLYRSMLEPLCYIVGKL
jgi:hypothetical protein